MARRKENSTELDSEIAKINREHGDIARRYGDAVAIDSIPTGVLSLDLALGCGGLPRGRMTEVFGPEGAGKSTVSFLAIGQVQANGGEAVYIDAENRLNPVWAECFGVNLSRLVYAGPDTGEQGLELVERFIKNGADIIVVDSAAALIPRAELEGDFGDQHMALQARLLSQGCRKLSTLVSKSNTALIFVNQIRDKMNAMGYGPTTDTPGGHALKHNASLRLEIKRIQTIKCGEAKTGTRVRANIVKSSVGPPFRTAEFEIYTGVCQCHAKGVDFAGDILAMAAAHGLVVKESATYKLRGGEVLGVGAAKAARALAENVELKEQIVREIIGGENG